MVALKHGLRTAPAVSERNEKTETGTMDATIEEIDLGPKKEGEIEVVPETGRKTLEESGATRGKEEREDTRMQSETAQGKGETGNGAGVGRSVNHGEVCVPQFLPSR